MSIARTWAAFVASLVLCCYFNTAQAQQTRTDLNLVIAIDCSYSVNSAEFALQVGGIAQALIDPLILETIKKGQHGSIAISIIQWSTRESQIVVLPWMRIANLQDGVRAAGLVAAMKRQTREGGTSIVGALEKGRQLLSIAPYQADRDVIDVIADGENNNGGRVENKRNELILQGITINALAVRNEVSYLHHYMRNRVIGGVGAFVERAGNYADFAKAFRKKLKREIEGSLFTRIVTPRL